MSSVYFSLAKENIKKGSGKAESKADPLSNEWTIMEYVPSFKVNFSFTIYLNLVDNMYQH